MAYVHVDDCIATNLIAHREHGLEIQKNVVELNDVTIPEIRNDILAKLGPELE